MSHNGLVFLIFLLDALGMAMIGGGIVLAHTETIPPDRGFFLCMGGGLVMLASIAVVHLLVMRKGGCVAGLVLCAISITALIAGGMQTPLYKLPRINDISTDHETPPELSVVLPGGAPPTAPAHPKEFVPHIKQHYADLKPLIHAKPPAELLKKVAEVVKALPGITDVRVDEARGLVHAVEVTPLMKFRDDFAVRVRAEGAGSRVDVRSRSRVGKSDLGANAARIRRVLEAIDRAAR